jgi:ABC-type Fe3+-hydroxamate transport system substrate-binding protein
MVESMNGAPDPGFSPQRVVSLLPAMTDSMIALGLGRFLVGITDSCRLPESIAGISRVGEAQDLKVADIVGLHPDLILAGGEENPQSQIEALTKAGLRIWWTSPRTVRQAVANLRDLNLIYATESNLQTVVWLDRAVDWLEASRPEKSVRAFCPRSREGTADHPEGWVTINRDTYTGDLLSLCGAENVFAERDSNRYPRVSPGEVIAAAPEIILLPGEPFPFTREDADAIRTNMPEIPAVQAERILLVDGRLLFWAGTRLGEAIRSLPALLRDRG